MKKLTFLRGIHIATLMSFLFIAAFFFLFVSFAPGNYDIDSFEFDLGSRIVDIIFAILILSNGICIILSFVSALNIFCKAVQSRTARKSQISDIALGLYPVIVVLFLGRGDISLLIEFFTAPFRILSTF